MNSATSEIQQPEERNRGEKDRGAKGERHSTFGGGGVNKIG